MIRKLTCIECPVGCLLSADVENCRVVEVSGNKCPKGETYAASEIENPVRILTSAVLSRGIDLPTTFKGRVLSENLSLKMVPVRTDKPIPRFKIWEAMAEIKKLRVNRPLQAGDAVVNNFLGLGVNLIATRDVI